VIRSTRFASYKVEWRTSQSPGACTGNRGFVVVVRILPQWKLADPDESGEVVHDARTDAPIVLVYLNRNREVTLKMRSSRPVVAPGIGNAGGRASGSGSRSPTNSVMRLVCRIPPGGIRQQEHVQTDEQEQSERAQRRPRRNV
jgi:hypothetical protein